MFNSLITAIMICGGVFFICSKIYESIKKKNEKDVHVMKRMAGSAGNLEDNNEKRKHSRIKKVLPVSLSVLSDGKTFEATTEGISISGAFVRCDSFIKLGERLKIRFLNENRLPIMAAQVIWSNSGVPQERVMTRGVGIRFTEVSKEARSVLEHILSEHK